MSGDLLLYSPSEAVPSPDELVAALAEEGWFAAVKGGASGVLHSGAVWGARSPARLAALKAARRAKRARDVKRFFDRDEAASVEVAVRVPFELADELSPGEIDEMARRLPAAAAGILRAAKSFYTVSVEPGARALALDFQEAVWRAVGGLAGGVLEDPQTGRGSVVTAAGRTSWDAAGDEL